jgi:hypothetical protein
VRIEPVFVAVLSEANKEFSRVERLKDNIARFHDRGILVDGGSSSDSTPTLRTCSTGPSRL